MQLPVTSLFVSLLALLIIFLAFRVVGLRRRHKIGVGTGDNIELQIAIRCHANAVEYCPIALLLLLVAESNGLPLLWLYILGTVLLLSRILHAWGLTKTQGRYSFGRFYGILGTWLVIIVLSGLNLSRLLGLAF